MTTMQLTLLILFLQIKINVYFSFDKNAFLIATNGNSTHSWREVTSLTGSNTDNCAHGGLSEWPDR